MGYLINGRTPEEIKQGLRCDVPCGDCAYQKCAVEDDNGCSPYVERDVLALIQHLEAQQPKWISVKERMPDKEGDYLVRKVHSYSDKDGYSKIDVCIYCRMRDPEWIGCGNLCEVTHWMPLPEPPEEDA